MVTGEGTDLKYKQRPDPWASAAVGTFDSISRVMTYRRQFKRDSGTFLRLWPVVLSHGCSSEAPASRGCREGYVSEFLQRPRKYGRPVRTREMQLRVVIFSCVCHQCQSQSFSPPATPSPTQTDTPSEKLEVEGGTKTQGSDKGRRDSSSPPSITNSTWLLPQSSFPRDNGVMRTSGII